MTTEITHKGRKVGEYSIAFDAWGSPYIMRLFFGKPYIVMGGGGLSLEQLARECQSLNRMAWESDRELARQRAS
jgi:hypothetical protein